LPGHAGAAVLLANTVSRVLVLFAKPLGGFLSDRVGRKRLMMILTVITIALVFVSLNIMLHGNPTQFMLGQLLLAVPLGMALGLQGAMVVEIFPMRTRVTSMSVAYSVTLAIAGGSAPLVSTWLIARYNQLLLPALPVVILGVLGIAIMAPMPETNRRRLDE
jgi:MHS family proline/betaine transporter-like MFS transporter